MVRINRQLEYKADWNKSSRKLGMKKYIYIFIFLCIVCSISGWWFMPVYFLRDADPVEVNEIRVYNGNSENEFVIMEPGDIAFIVNSIKEISFKKYEICSEAGYWYYLSFISKNGEEIESLGIQNSRYLRKDISQGCAAFYSCEGELGAAADYLESIEGTQFPDYKKDRDFAGRYCE